MKIPGNYEAKNNLTILKIKIITSLVVTFIYSLLIAGTYIWRLPVCKSSGLFSIECSIIGLEQMYSLSLMSTMFTLMTYGAPIIIMFAVVFYSVSNISKYKTIFNRKADRLGILNTTIFIVSIVNIIFTVSFLFMAYD